MSNKNNQDWSRVLAKVGRNTAISAVGALAREVARAMLPAAPPAPKAPKVRRKPAKVEVEPKEG